jgi:hypothetical protein
MLLLFLGSRRFLPRSNTRNFGDLSLLAKYPAKETPLPNKQIH